MIATNPARIETVVVGDIRRLVRAQGSSREQKPLRDSTAPSSKITFFSIPAARRPDYDRQVAAAISKRRPKYAIDNMSASSLRSFEYLEGLPGTTFNRLYKQPSTALAIYRRMLPHLGMPHSLKSLTVGADKPSKEFRNGFVIHQPPYACHRPGSLGAS